MPLAFYQTFSSLSVEVTNLRHQTLSPKLQSHFANVSCDGGTAVCLLALRKKQNQVVTDIALQALAMVSRHWLGLNRQEKPNLLCSA